MDDHGGSPQRSMMGPSLLSFPNIQSRRRTYSSSSLDPNEDPATGLERVSSLTNLHSNRRRRRADDVPRIPEGHAAHQEEQTLSAKFESLNYEVCESELYRQEEKKESHQLTLFKISRNRWIACFFIGIVTACFAAAIDILVHYSKEFKFGVLLRGFLSRCENELESTGNGSCMWTVELAWILYNCTLVGVAAFLVIWVSPIAGGSGIPQIKCFLNGIEIPQVVRLKTLIAKSVGVACSVAGGLAAGKEGPMIHSGAVVGAGISQGRSRSLGFDTGCFKEFRNDRERRDFVSAGAAAGVAAAFGAPIGGVLFSLEEGASFWNQNLTWRMFFTALVSAFTLNSILALFHGRGGWLSWNGLANFGVFENKDYNMWEIPCFLLIGVIGGFTGAAFNALNLRISEFRKKYVSSKGQRFLEALLVAAISAFTGFLTIFLVDDCQPVGINPNFTEVNQMWCKKGEYSAVASLFFSNPEDSVKSLFHSPINSYRPWTLLIFSIEYFLLTAWTFGLAVPSGVFIPAILCGAAWGRLVGVTIEHLIPNITGIDPGKYALAGAAAQLGGLVRMTISLTAILMEATKDITFGLPIMLVLMTTKLVGDLFTDGLYDLHIELQGIPILGWHPPKMTRNIKAEKIMRKDVVAFERRERVCRIREVLRSTSHHGFPVVDRIDESATDIPDYGKLQGIILRSHLIVLLKNRVFTLHPDGRSGCLGSVTLSDFTDDAKLENVEDIGLSHEDDLCWMDMSSYLHPHPHRVPENASLPFVFKLFRGLGLRYLMVVNDGNRLRGIITRKDVARYRETRDKKAYRVQELFIAEDSENP